jgi:hypothetical protein
MARFDRTHIMAPGQHSPLQLPSFLQGTFAAVQRKTRTEGRRCAEQYRENGSFPASHELLTVPPGEVVLTHEVADLQRERPAWRLYMISSVMGALGDALNWQDTSQVRARYEASCLETPWGALYFAVTQPGVLRPERVARRLQAVLRFWEHLESARYLFKTLNPVLTLDELMNAACDWAMDTWGPAGETSVRARLETATELMARATREDSIQAILRQMPRVLAHSPHLKHRDVLADPAFLQERLEMLAPPVFERVSAASTPDLLGQLYAWDRQLEKQ